MDKKKCRRQLLAFRRKKSRFLKSLPKRTNQNLITLAMDGKVMDALDLDDDDMRAVDSELSRRGVHLFEGEEVPIEEIFDCPTCDDLRIDLEGKKHLH